MTSAMTKSGTPEYGGANGSAPVDSVTTRGIVVQVNTDWPNGRVVIHRCTVRDAQTGIETTGLPCAGMNLQPGEAITITIQRQNPKVLRAGHLVDGTQEPVVGGP